MSVPELQDYEHQTTSFDAFGWFRTGRFRLTAPGEPQLVPGAAVTPALARQLGPPRLGQWFFFDQAVEPGLAVRAVVDVRTDRVERRQLGVAGQPA